MKNYAGLSALFAAFATPALAHHPLAGAPMETFAHGVFSGIGHPILGFDHMFFIIAVGVAAALVGRLSTAPLGYLAGMLGGVALVTAGVALPAVEVMIAASLVVLGGLIASGASLRAMPVMALFAAAGLFHGWAFGGTIVGQEGGMGASVLAGYLLGLVAVQYAVAYVAGALLGKGTAAVESFRPRLAGAVVAGVGMTFMLEHVEGAAFAALGLG